MKEMKVIRKRRRRSVSRYNKKRSRIPLIIAMTFCAMVLVLGVCTLCFKFLSNSEYSPAAMSTPSEPCVIENGENTSLIVSAGEIHVLTVPLADNELDKINFKSSDEAIVTVDSGGRIDAKKEGEAVVTAQGGDFNGQCTVTVKKAQKKTNPADYTTAYIANPDIVKKNKDNKSKNPYSVTINRRTNTVTVYTYDENGDYVVPVRAMVCSCGEQNEENITPTGTYSVYFKEYWHPLYGDVYGKYVTGFSGPYLFHSVPYLQTESDTLKAKEFNKLGKHASQGCVRLMIADAKWIYDNLEMGTEVIVIDADSKEDPLGTPPTIKIDESVGWDPTDPDKDNVYNDKFPIISGAKDIAVEKDSDFIMNVTAVDSCSNDITDKIVTFGNVITSKSGEYKVTYSVTDDLGKSAQATITVTVK